MEARRFTVGGRRRIMHIRKELVIMAVLTAFCFLGPLAGSTVQAEPFQTTDNLTVQINWLEHNLSNARMD
jgi:hypothetical protein